MRGPIKSMALGLQRGLLRLLGFLKACSKVAAFRSRNLMSPGRRVAKLTSIQHVLILDAKELNKGLPGSRPC